MRPRTISLAEDNEIQNLPLQVEEPSPLTIKVLLIPDRYMAHCTSSYDDIMRIEIQGVQCHV